MLDPIRKHLRVGGALLTLLLAFLALYMAVTGNHPDPQTAQRTDISTNNDLASVAWSNSLRLQESARDLYVPSGRNIFQLVSESSRANQPLHSPKSTPTPSSTPNRMSEVPAQPHIGLIFYGFVKKAGAAKRVFLQEGESIFIGSEGEIIDRHYKIVRVAETSVEVEDLLNNYRQMLQLQEHS